MSLYLKFLAYYIDWFVCPVSAVRAGHSAVDLRTCTDADLILCSVCIEELVGGLLRAICFEKSVSLNQFDVLLRVRGHHYSPKLSTGACHLCCLILALRWWPKTFDSMHCCCATLLDDSSWSLGVFPRRIADIPACVAIQA